MQVPASAFTGEKAVGGQAVDRNKKIDDILATRKPQHIKTASLADILGFNPRKSAPPVSSTDPLDGLSQEEFNRYHAMPFEDALALDAPHYEVWIAVMKLSRRDQLEDWQWKLRDAHSHGHRQQVEHRVHTANQFGLSCVGDRETPVEPSPLLTRMLPGMAMV